jgi:hypothetical protein
LDGVEGAKERREKAESEDVSDELDGDSLYEPIEPIGPVLSHHLGIVFTRVALNHFLTVDELKRDERKGKREGHETYLWVMGENVEREFQEIYHRLAGHPGATEESSGERLETETKNFDEGVCSSGRFPLNDRDDERPGGCR